MREVRAVPVGERALPRTVTATGTLAAEDQVALGARVAGRVERIDVELGTRVRRGQEITQLDQTDFTLWRQPLRRPRPRTPAREISGGQNGNH